MVVQFLNYYLKKILYQIPGWHTKRKLVVFESDDWGAIRMPSREVFDFLESKNINVSADPYCKFDSLESAEDLDRLFDLLTSFKDINGNFPIFTANTIVANPDFREIKNSEFENYYYKRFTSSFEDRFGDNSSFDLIKKGVELKIWKPQFHGREHLYIKKWLNDLNDKSKKTTRIAFDVGCYGLTSDVCSSINGNYMGALNSGIYSDIKYFESSIIDGLNIFYDIFGFRSESFIPTTYTWHPDIENNLSDQGIKFLQGMIHQRIPIDDDNCFKFKKTNFLGCKSKSGLTYLTRNVFFEPSQNENFDWIYDCMNRIKLAFLMNKPVIISTHRLNFIGSIHEYNRDRGLKLLSLLLSNLLKKFPAVEFISSDELGRLILEDKL